MKHSLLIVLVSTIALAQKNPIPLVDQPLVPTSVKPGSGGFTLTVNGTGFSSGAVVKWNGSARTTEVISSSRVKATIKAADVAKAGTATVTVANPSPGGGSSSVLYFTIRDPLSSVALAVRPGFGGAFASTTGDFNGDGILDVVTGVNDKNGNWVISLFRGNGDGTFKKPIQSVISAGGADMTKLRTVDFNHDRKLDLAVDYEYGEDIGTVILQNDGNGQFSDTGLGFGGVATFADLNGDGALDAVAVGQGYGDGVVFIYLGDGKGGFTKGQTLNIDSGGDRAVIGDFNHDGKLDLAIPTTSGPEVIVFLGNGDGTFPANGVSYGSGYGTSLIAADVNGDGNLDFIDSGCVLLGKGDGTFNLDSCTSVPFDLPALGDFNGDGKLDLVGVTFDAQQNRFVNIALGKGNGKFTAPIAVEGGGAPGEILAGLAAGDFNGDGWLDVVSGASSNTTVLLQTVARVSPNTLAFADQKVGTKSKPQTVVLKNIDTKTLTIDGITVTGKNAKSFGQANNCGTSLPAGGSCKIRVTFRPKASGDLAASVQVTYEANGGPQLISLTGIGMPGGTVSLTPSKLTFPTQLVGTTSSGQTATLTNTGTVAVIISKISASAPFAESNNCPSSLPAGQSCQISVSFKPTDKGLASGQLSVSDDAEGSPQTVALSGTGTVVKLSPIGVTFGDQKVGTKSAPVPVQLTNVGTTTLSITSIAVTGMDRADFSQTNNCGNSVPAGGSCTIKVRFQPTKTGRRSAEVSFTDDGGGSPQKLPVSGTGT